MIHVRDLRKVYYSAARWRQILRGKFRGDEVVALGGVDLDVGKGEIHALMGPNGAGKSTLLRILSGLVLPTSGEVSVSGSVAFVVADERSFSWRLSGRDNLKFFASLYGYTAREAKDRIAHALDRVGLGPQENRAFREYSTGMRQRLALARGLLSDADIFLLDEPTRGVDPDAARALRHFVRDELARKLVRTVLLATHDLYEARALASRVSLLEHGRIQRVVESEAVSELFPLEQGYA